MLAQNYVSPLEQLFARLCKDYAARGADEELGACLILELPDLHADRRLRHMDARGSCGKGAGFGDGDEGFYLTDVHGVILHQQGLSRE